MMKMRYSLGRTFLPAAFCLAVLSCTSNLECELPDTVTTVIEASTSETMKTTLDGKDVLWTASDTLACLCYTNTPSIWSYMGGIAPKSFSGKNAKFEITTLAGLQPKILVNPDNTAYSLDSDGNVLIPLSSTYYVVHNAVPQESMISVGYIDAGKSTMRNVLTYMKFTVESSDICRILVRANDSTALSGTLRFNPVTLESRVEGDNGINIYPSDSSGLFSPGVYYVPVPSVTCGKGLNVKFYKSNGDAAKKSLDSAYVIKRNRFIDMGRESDWGLVFNPATRKISITFRDSAGGLYFPFSDKSDAKTAVAIPAVGNVAGKGRIGPYYPLGYPGVKVHFFVAKSEVKSYFTVQGTYGLRYGGSVGDYMTIPALDGYRLSAFSLEYGSKTSYYAVTTDPESGEPDKMVTFSGKAKTYSKTFSSGETKTGVSYRVSTTATNETAIQSVTYTYEIDD